MRGMTFVAGVRGQYRGSPHGGRPEVKGGFPYHIPFLFAAQTWGGGGITIPKQAPPHHAFLLRGMTVAILETARADSPVALTVFRGNRDTLHDEPVYAALLGGPGHLDFPQRLTTGVPNMGRPFYWPIQSEVVYDANESVIVRCGAAAGVALGTALPACYVLVIGRCVPVEG